MKINKLTNNNMPRSKVRGGRKAHNKRIAKRKEQMKADFKAIEELKRKIYNEAKERYEQEQNIPPQSNTFKIKL